MKDPAKFVYFYRTSGAAVVFDERDDLTTAQLLFTCPESFLPRNQLEFNLAARYYGVKAPESMKYESDSIPF